MSATPDDARAPSLHPYRTLDPEDSKLLVLARAARSRTGGAEGAAVRDDIGRTYSAATVSLAALQLTAVQAAVAAAVSSGAQTVAAVAVVGSAGALNEPDRGLLADLAVPTVLLGGPDGNLLPATVGP